MTCRSRGKTTAVGAGLVVSTHEDRIVGNHRRGQMQGPNVRYKVATLHAPSPGTRAMKAIVAW